MFLIMANVLIIDDDKNICDLLVLMVREVGHNAVAMTTLRDGLDEAMSGNFDVVFLDVIMPDGNGLEAIRSIRETPAAPEVIIITGEGSSDGVEVALKNGAWDYLQKPLSIKGINLALGRVLQYRESLHKAREPVVALKLKGIVCDSPEMKACIDLLAKAANSEANVLITGETGTGKELFARAVHENSKRKDKNFVVVDCAALPETLAESLLFGHKKGAFTGADKSKGGLVMQADGGTLFLDELGELSPYLQKVFLRVLQERRFRPVGASHEVDSDFRLLAVTNRNLEQMVAAGSFRDDLLFRIKGMTIELPPLRNRREDIKDLVVLYVAKICDRYGIETKGVAADFIDAITSYEWPGNVRELIGALEKAIGEAYHDPLLFSKHLPTQMRIQLTRAAVIDSDESGPEILVSEKNTSIVDAFPTYREVREATLAEAERKYFQDLMMLTKGSIKEACRISGLGRTRLYTLMKRHDISRDGWSYHDTSSN